MGHPIQDENIFIIAGGPSAKGIDYSAFKPYGYILGVNDAYFHAPCDGVLTVDSQWLNHRWEQLKALGCDAFIKQKSRKKYFNLSEPWDKAWFFFHNAFRKGLSESFDLIHGDNSGAAALNYAYLCHPKRIFLFGLDMTQGGTGRDHWYPNYPWARKKHERQYDPWLDWFDSTTSQIKAAGIQVYNVSAISRLRAYPKITPAKVIGLLHDSTPPNHSICPS